MHRKSTVKETTLSSWQRYKWLSSDNIYDMFRKVYRNSVSYRPDKILRHLLVLTRAPNPTPTQFFKKTDLTEDWGENTFVWSVATGGSALVCWTFGLAGAGRAAALGFSCRYKQEAITSGRSTERGAELDLALEMFCRSLLRRGLQVWRPEQQIGLRCAPAALEERRVASSSTAVAGAKLKSMEDLGGPSFLTSLYWLFGKGYFQITHQMQVQSSSFVHSSHHATLRYEWLLRTYCFPSSGYHFLCMQKAVSGVPNSNDCSDKL